MKSQWLKAIQEARRTEGHFKRQPGFKTSKEIAKELGILENSANRIIADFRKKGKVLVGKMTFVKANGRRQHIPTYKLK